MNIIERVYYLPVEFNLMNHRNDEIASEVMNKYEALLRFMISLHEGFELFKRESRDIEVIMNSVLEFVDEALSHADKVELEAMVKEIEETFNEVGIEWN